MKTCGETATLRWDLCFDLSDKWAEFRREPETVVCHLQHGHDGPHYGVGSGPSGLQWGYGPAVINGTPVNRLGLDA